MGTVLYPMPPILLPVDVETEALRVLDARGISGFSANRWWIFTEIYRHDKKMSAFMELLKRQYADNPRDVSFTLTRYLQPELFHHMLVVLIPSGNVISLLFGFPSPTDVGAHVTVQFPVWHGIGDILPPETSGPTAKRILHRILLGGNVRNPQRSLSLIPGTP